MAARKPATTRTAPKKAAKTTAAKAPAAAPRAAPAAAATAPAAAAAAPAGGQPYPQTPALDMPMAAVVMVVNVIIPGLGTLIAGILAHQKLIGRAVAQFLLAIVLVGWVWSIITGIQALINASWKSKAAGNA